MVRTNTKRKANHMIKKQLKFLILLSLICFQGVSSSENNIYNKIDLFGEVLEKINKEYVDEINQSESMDSAINGCLLYTSPSPRDTLLSRMPSSA